MFKINSATFQCWGDGSVIRCLSHRMSVSVWISALNYEAGCNGYILRTDVVVKGTSLGLPIQSSYLTLLNFRFSVSPSKNKADVNWGIHTESTCGLYIHVQTYTVIISFPFIWKIPIPCLELIVYSYLEASHGSCRPRKSWLLWEATIELLWLTVYLFPLQNFHLPFLL